MIKTKNAEFDKAYNEVGRPGEETIIQYFISLGYQVEDIDDLQQQKKGTDIVINGKTIEIKTDTCIAKTGNIFCEVGNERKGWFEEGWIKKIQADFLLVYDTKNQYVYLIDVQQLKNLYDKIGNYKRFWHSNDACFSQAYVVPLKLIYRLGFLLCWTKLTDCDYTEFINFLGEPDEE